jgi:Phosphomannomutase
MVVDMLQFGTDGVRGRVGVDLHEADIARLGVAVAREWPGTQIVIGHDGRESGPAWLAVFASGVATQGNAVMNAGCGAHARTCLGGTRPCLCRRGDYGLA